MMTVKSLLVRFGTDIDSLKAGFQKADAIIDKHQKDFKKAGKIMVAAGATITGMVAGVVKAYADFDKSLTESTAIMGDVSDDMKKKMADAAKEMSENSTFAAKDLAQAYYYLASAGMDAEQSIAALPVVTKFAQAGAFDLATATDLLTDAQTALGLSSKDAKENQENLIKVSDVLVKANTLANASVQQFSEALTNKAAAALVNVNKGMEEGVAVLAAYADKGVKGELAGQRLTMMLNGLDDATSKNKKAWDAYGISLYDSNGEMRSIADIIKDMEDRLSTMTTEQKQATLAQLGFNMRTKDSILTLMGSSEKIRNWTKELKTAGGTTEDVANKQLKSLTNQLTIAKNTIVNTAISLGEQLAPTIVEVAGKIKAIIEKVRDWIKEHPELTKNIALTAAKVGILLTFLGPIAMMLPGLVSGFTLLAGAFSAMTGPVGLVAIAITTIALAAKEMAKNLREAKKAMEDFADEAQVFGDAANNFQKLWIVVRKQGGETLKQFNELMERFGGNWEHIMKQIIRDPKFATLKSLLKDIASGVREVETEGKNLSITLPKGFRAAGNAAEEGGEDTVEAWREVTEVIETEVHPALRKIGGITEQAVLAAMLGTGRLKQDLINLSTIFPEELEPSVLSTFEIMKNAVSDFRERQFDDCFAVQENWKETLLNIAECASVAISGIDAAFAQAYTNQMIRIDNEEKRTLEAIDNKYNATIEANKATVEAEEEKTKQILKEIENDYKKKKAYIEKNVKNEEERKAMLEDLEKQYENQLEQARIDREKAEQDAADALERIEEAKNEALRLASEELERKREEARRTAAKQEKAVALMSAIVNTAAGVTKALSSGIPPWNIILAGITAAAGAVQIGLIAAQPLPLAEGGLVTKPTTALIGEAGPELVIPLNKLQPAFAGVGGGFKQNNYFYGDINNAGDLDEISRRLAERTRRAVEGGRI